MAISRRTAIRSLAASAVISPALYRAAHAADAPPSDKIRLAFVGVGNQGSGNLKAFLKQEDVTVVAVCDVDSKRVETAAAEVLKQTGVEPIVEGDYRKLLERKDVDALVVTTPDHWHALITVDACRAGKDVYCEKPLSLTISEGRAMVNAARDGKRIVQTGSQQRSDANFRRACELVRSGAVGKVHTVKVGLPGVNFSPPPVPDSDPPMELDYQRWLGPAPDRPYNAKRVHYLFRFFWDYSGGQQTNFGAHHLDIAQWGLGRDNSGPVSVTGEAKFQKDGWYEVPEWSKIEYTYDDNVKLLCGQDFAHGTLFEGDKGKLFVSRGQFNADPVSIAETPRTVKLTESSNHHRNWLDCIKSRELPICDVEIGHRSATVCHLGNIAIRSGKKVTWDPVAEKIVGDDETAAMVERPYRKPWSLNG